MTSVQNISFAAAEPQKTKAAKPQQKEVVYVSKNPDATVNATGVVAGTAGMVGGAVLGGTVGLCKLPAGLASAAANANYADAFKTSLSGFKAAVESSPELSNLINAFRSTSTPEAAEEIVNIAKTLSERLNVTLKDDAAAKAVINKTIDPILNRCTIGLNGKVVGGGILKLFTGWIPSSIPIIGKLNPRTTFFMQKGFAESIAAGFADAAVNIANFTPEEKAAWGRVATEIKNEFMTNPKLKTAGAVGKALGAMATNFDWISVPFKNMQKTLANLVKDVNKTFGNAPIKTIGKWSAIGAAVCGTLSTLGWFGLKKGLMTKENEKAIKAGIA